MSEVTPPEAVPAPPPVKTKMKIADIGGRMQYGNNFDFGPGGIDQRITHPTHADIQKAIDDGYLIDRPFSGNQDALLHEWIAAAGGHHDRAKFIEVATRWHAGRIAYLVKNIDPKPIGIRADHTVHDGQHRLFAAEFRGDTEIEVEIG